MKTQIPGLQSGATLTPLNVYSHGSAVSVFVHPECCMSDVTSVDVAYVPPKISGETRSLLTYEHARSPFST
jgi:hypothetical protein